MGCESSTPVPAYESRSRHSSSYSAEPRYKSRTQPSYERREPYQPQPALYAQRSFSTSGEGQSSAHISGVGHAQAGSAKVISKDEVAKHRTAQDCWVIIDGQVYDVTVFLRTHPGGSGAILPFAGRDITRASYSAHSYVNFRRTLARWHKGALAPA